MRIRMKSHSRTHKLRMTMMRMRNESLCWNFAENDILKMIMNSDILRRLNYCLDWFLLYFKIVRLLNHFDIFMNSSQLKNERSELLCKNEYTFFLQFFLKLTESDCSVDLYLRLRRRRTDLFIIIYCLIIKKENKYKFYCLIWLMLIRSASNIIEIKIMRLLFFDVWRMLINEYIFTFFLNELIIYNYSLIFYWYDKKKMRQMWSNLKNRANKENCCKETTY